MKILLIDNYDSFTYNLWHYMSELGAQVDVYRNNEIKAGDIINKKPKGIIISPGPGEPIDAGVCLDLLKLSGLQIPILGVCLGHQCIGQSFGGKIIRAPIPVHGKVSKMSHDGSGIFNNVPSPFRATRYHSLIIDPSCIPDCLKITAKSDDGVVQALAHKKFPIFGVQFHPESISSEFGHEILENFLKISNAR